jgi:hypothetical protein
MTEKAGEEQAPLVNRVKTVELTAYEQLSNLQRQRADYLKAMIGDHAIALVPQLDSRGRNSWPVVYEKVMRIHQANYDEQRYQTALSENFDVDTIYAPSEIISIVGQIRQDLGLHPYLVNLNTNCESDFFNIFIVKDVYEMEITAENKKKGKLLGYKPVFCIKPVGA